MLAGPSTTVGLSFLLSLMFSIQDPTFSNGNSPTGATWPYATLYWDVFEAWRPGKGKGGATFFMVILMIANVRACSAWPHLFV